MHLNFCDHTINPKFSCDKPSHDGYAVTNLASKNYSERQQGFLAFGSPPATVTIDFIGAANIEHIYIWPQVLSQKSVGLEISVRCADRKKQIWQSFSATASQQSGTTYVGQDDSYYRVGSVILESNDKGVVFSRQESTIDPVNSQLQIMKDFSQKVLFRHSSLTNADSLKIKIFKSTSSVPALKKVEVWGVPGSMCSKQLVRDIYNLWQASSHYQLHNPKKIPKEQSLFTEKCKVNIEQKCISSDIELPEEFLDAITCDVMVLPFILPSGKLVDQQTLNKHKEFEARYGRAPSDPFTGKPFTNNYQPVPNHDLKRRINLFLTENGHHKDLQHVPRTTGTKAAHILEKNIQIHKATQQSLSKEETNCNYSSTQGSSTQKTKCRTNTVPALDKTKRVKLCDNSNTTKAFNSIFGPDGEKPSWLQSRSISSSADRDDAFLDARLDMALRDALQGCPTYVNFIDNAERLPLPVEQSNVCGDCNGVEILYRLPCNHLICRPCLVPKKGDLMCGQCHKLYQSSNAIRFHIS